MRKKSFLFVGLGILTLVCLSGVGIAEAAQNLEIIDQGVGLSSVDSSLKDLARGFVRLARPIVAIMTAIAGVMAILNVGDNKRPMWYAILGIGLILNMGDVLLSLWGKYANPQTGWESAIEYSVQIKDTANADGNGVDILSTFMKYYLEIVVTGAERIKPIAIKLLLILALIDTSIRLALDLTEKDKMAWMVKTFLRIGFYVFLIHNWIGIDGLNLMDTLSKGFQEIGFVAGNYGQALPTSVADISSIDPKDNLSPDSIVNNGFKMMSAIFGAEGSVEGGISGTVKQTAGKVVGIFATGGLGPLVVIITTVLSILCIFLTGIEMFMARIEFYTLALLGVPLLAFGAIKHFEYLAQQTIRAMFNCGVKLCVISFLQAIVCRMFTKYINNVVDAQTGLFKDWHIVDNYGHLIATLFQLMLVSIIMFLLVRAIPKLIQGLLSGNPALGGSDMIGTAAGVATTAATVAGTTAGVIAGASGASKQLASGSGGGSVPMKMSEMPDLSAKGAAGSTPQLAGGTPRGGQGDAPSGGGQSGAASGSSQAPKSTARILAGEALRRTPVFGRAISSYESARDGVYRHEGIDTHRNNNQENDSSKYKNDPSVIPPTIHTKDDEEDEDKRNKNT